MKPIETWILIADGASARVAVNRGPGKGIEDLEGMTFASPHPSAKDIMADRPGRTFNSAGTARHAMEMPSDPVRELERKFAEELGDTLAKNNSRFDRLVLVAAPAMLGILRKSLPPLVQKKVTHELSKDLTNVPTPKLTDHLAEILPA